MTPVALRRFRVLGVQAMIHHRHRVGFAEVDAAGIAFFSRAFEIAHAAFETALAEIGMPLGEILRQNVWVMPLVHAEADYRVPMRLGDELLVEVTVEKIGRSSVTFNFRFTSGQGAVDHGRSALSHLFQDASWLGKARRERGGAVGRTFFLMYFF
mgnify:CR=1 FL=1